MSTMPNPVPHDPDEEVRRPMQPEVIERPRETQAQQEVEEAESRLAAPGAPESESYFQSYDRFLRPPRSPNVFDVLLMAVLLGVGWLASGGLTATALHFHLFGVMTEKQAINDIHYTLGSQAAWYVITFAMWVMFFPCVWDKGFFEGIEWGAAAAVRLRWQLFRAAFACFVLAIVDGLVLPGPKEAPIDQVFRLPGAAWLLFLFGITLAPFFEEMCFRGFLLPALCTAWEWSWERIEHRPPREPDMDGRTRWSPAAMIVGSLLTSIPFALIHGEQTGYSLGPFLLLVCVSLVLCWVRLSMRSVAASTVVHACYNLLLFALMIWGTGGFRHMDRM